MILSSMMSSVIVLLLSMGTLLTRVAVMAKILR